MPSRILIVEDNSQNLELMRYLLAASGHEVMTTVDGAAAIDLLSRESPDLILSDIQMPKVDGFEFLNWLRAQDRLRTIPVIAVTAQAMVGDRDRILAAGFNGYLSKPIVPETFVGQVIAHLAAGQQSPPKPPSLVTAPQPVPAPTTGPQIMLVDDLQSNLDLAQVILAHMGYQTLQAKGMQEALRCLEEATPALILSDVHMRDGNGLELLQSVRRNPALRDIPFILLTSTATNERERQKGLALGANRYLYRPIDAQELCAEIGACLAQSKDQP